MQDKLLSAKEYVRLHFPEIGDVEPTASEPAPGISVFSFRKTFTTPDGASLSQTVRVTIGEDGRVIKVSMSK